MNLLQHPIGRMAVSLTQLIRKHAPGTFFLSAAIGIAGGLSNTASIAYIHQAVKGGATPPMSHLAVFLLLCLFAQATRTLSQYLLWKGCLRSTVGLVTGLTGSILATPLRRLEELGSSRILTVLERDSVSLADTIITIPLLLLNCTVLLASAMYLAWQSPVAAVAFLVLVVIATGSTMLVIHWSTDLLTRARAQIDRLFEYFRAQSAGVKELKLHAQRRAEFLAGLHETAELACSMEVKVQTIYAGSAGWFQLVFLIPIGILVFALTNMARIPVTEVGAYALVLLYMTGTISALSSQFSGISRGVIAYRNIEKLGMSLEKPPSTAGSAAPSNALARNWTELELADVTHAFQSPDGFPPFVVGPVSLRFQRGEMVFITGGNGSGKTTLAKLLCGLYVPDSGTIRLDGTPVTAESVEEYRQYFSGVFWDFHLFTRLFGLGSEQVEQRARAEIAAMQLQNKVDVVNGEFTTLKLSQGQRKRLALLVGTLEDRDIYIFDEWAADQDHTFRDHFYYKILPGLRAAGKTVFVISHDERYFAVADRVLKLELGSVVSDTVVELHAATA